MDTEYDMRRLICSSAILVLISFRLFAQCPSYADSISRSLDQANKRKLDQARMEEDKRHNLALEALAREELAKKYAEHKGLDDQLNTEEGENAFNACRALHDDCDNFRTKMFALSTALRSDQKRMTMAEYVEILYVVSKNRNFSLSNSSDHRW